MQGDWAPECAPDETTVVSRAHLERLQRVASVGAVASSVAHEFNNILTSILNHAKTGARSTDIETCQKAFEKILGSARRAAKITTGMLALSHNRAARKQPTDVSVLVEEVLAILEKDLAKHQVRLERSYEPAPPVEVVAAQIEQVIMNLVINARQAMPRGGTVTLSIAHNRESGMVEIGVSDTGSGIEPDKLGKIFEPFYSTKDGPDQEGQGGSGLGLAICREIIERHEGRIRVESLVGHGTTFTIKLPVASVQARPFAA